jgi:hypothetical protein
MPYVLKLTELIIIIRNYGRTYGNCTIRLANLNETMELLFYKPIVGTKLSNDRIEKRLKKELDRRLCKRYDGSNSSRIYPSSNKNYEQYFSRIIDFVYILLIISILCYFLKKCKC